MLIRVLHIVTYMGRGGLETMIMNHYRQIDRDKVQFDFLVHRDFEADYDREILELGGKIYRLPPLNPFGRTYKDALNTFFAEHPEYRIVHSHLDCMSGVVLKVAKKHGVPIRIAHAHSSSQTKDSKYLLKLYFKSRIKHNATHLFACGEKAGHWMFGVDNFRVINNAIDTRKYAYDNEIAQTIRRQNGLDEQALVVGHVGRFAPPKNHRFLVQVFAEILKKQSYAWLLLVGDGELRAEIERYAKELGVEEHVIFAGQCANVHALLQAMDVFVFPSLYEGLPLSLIEAQAAGLPCLISDRVPIECKKTDLVEQMSLEESASSWADRLLIMSQRERVDTSADIATAGFDVTANAAWLQQYYLEAYKGC